MHNTTLVTCIYDQIYLSIHSFDNNIT